MNTLLQKLLAVCAKRILKKYHPKVIGITGSVGKTSTKEAIAAVVGIKFRVRGSQKNYNNEIGVPLTIIGIDCSPGSSLLGWLFVFVKAIKLLFSTDSNYPELLVLEMAADKPGDISYLVDLAPCEVGVLTAITRAHTESFKSIKKVAQEKKNIITHLSTDGFAILNIDNELVRELTSATEARVLSYGWRAGADFQASDARLVYGDDGWPIGINCKVNVKGSSVPIFLPGVVAEHLILPCLAALAIAEVYDINLIEAAGALKAMPLLPGRMQLIPGIKKTLLIDDSYNSSPEAAKAALATLASIQIKPGAERYAVLGDMLELGEDTKAAHREVGFTVAEQGIDYLITVGEASKLTAEAAREAGLPDHHVAAFADTTAAGKFLQEELEEGDIVLVKGSQGLRMERVIKEVMDEPLRAEELLVRQEEEWK